MDENLLDITEYVRAVRNARVEGRLLVAVGGFGGPRGHDRVGVLDLRVEGSTVLVDAWLESSAVPVLVDALLSEGLEVREGGWDTMYATGHHFAWTSDGRGPFEVWSREGRVCTIVEGMFRSSNTPVPADAIAAVEPFVGGDWIERGVRLRTSDGTLVTVVSDEDQAPALDPTYDGLNLMADVGWTHALARALAEGLGGRPIVDCT